MVLVQGGTLPPSSQLAGSFVAAFQIGKYEVTWDEWQEVRAWAVTNGYSDLAGVGLGSSGSQPVRGIGFYDTFKWINARSEKEGLIPVYEVNGVTYRTGENFPSSVQNANGYRLPTDYEWEWAARGGLLSQGYVYSGSNDLNAVAWYNDPSPGSEPKPVGTKAANELGIHDMSGNVWEWVYGPTYFRGGSWIDSNTDWFKVDHRNWGWPGHGTEYFGFRVASAEAIPEPSTYTLLAAFGLCALLFARRR